MNIIDVALVAGVVGDNMLPVMPLPYATFVGCFSDVRSLGNARENPLLIKRHRFAQQIDLADKQVVVMPLQQVCRKKPSFS